MFADWQIRRSWLCFNVKERQLTWSHYEICPKKDTWIIFECYILFTNHCWICLDLMSLLKSLEKLDFRKWLPSDSHPPTLGPTKSTKPIRPIDPQTCEAKMRAVAPSLRDRSTEAFAARRVSTISWSRKKKNDLMQWIKNHHFFCLERTGRVIEPHKFAVLIHPSVQMTLLRGLHQSWCVHHRFVPIVHHGIGLQKGWCNFGKPWVTSCWRCAIADLDTRMPCWKILNMIKHQ